MSAVTWGAIDRRPPITAAEIEHAIENDELFVVYRPQLRLNERHGTPRFEALAQWRHPRWGVLSAEAFMPRASHAGLAPTLTEWLVTTTLRQTRLWRRAGDDVDLSIDLWPADIHRFLAGTLAAVLEFSGAAPAAITCELPEAAVAEDATRAANVTADLGWLGVRVSLDGVGRGAMPLGLLRSLHLDEVKLAPELVEDIDVSAERAAQAVAAIASAHACGLEVVACGVRSEADLAAVSALGCDAAEGPAISTPIDAFAALGWLRARAHDG
jgi:diguanylate cyclase